MSEMRIYVEGGGNAKIDNACKKGFHQLLENVGFKGRVPRIVACGSRDVAYDRFKTAINAGITALLIVNSEDPASDISKTWEHLKKRDSWERPAKANDEQVLLMTTCMETWVIADIEVLRKIFPKCLNENPIPKPSPLSELEKLDRHAMQDALDTATRSCTNAYKKGKRSFALLAQLSPATLKRLPSFQRMHTILDRDLPSAR